MDLEALANQDSYKIRRELLLEALEFKETLLKRNRFFVSHPFLDRIIKSIDNIDSPLSPFQTKYIEENTELFRARICDEQTLASMQFEYIDVSASFLAKKAREQLLTHDITSFEDPKCFRGYNAINSYIPPEHIKTPDGRINPQYIRYLYTARDAYTALVECRPMLNSYVSIAKILVKRPLTIIELPSQAQFNDIEYLINNGFEIKYLSSIIHSIFSTPCSGELKDYLPAQYISEYIKSLDNGTRFDGICFESALNRSGMNITIFNHEKCCAVSSQVFKVNDIQFEAQCVLPYKSSKFSPSQTHSCEET